MKASQPRTMSPVSERLRVLRIALGIETQAAFAKRYGFGITQWNNFENGSQLSIAAAIRLVRQIHGLSLDWLYLGNTSAMASGLLRKIEQAEQETSAISA